MFRLWYTPYKSTKKETEAEERHQIISTKRTRYCNYSYSPWSYCTNRLSMLQFIGLSMFCISRCPQFFFFTILLSSALFRSVPLFLFYLNARFQPLAPMQQSRKITHLSGLMAAGGLLCAGGGAWLARMRSFRRLPCCKVIVIKSWLTVADFCLWGSNAFPLHPQKSFPPPLKKEKSYPHQILDSVCEYWFYLWAQMGWNELDSPNFLRDYFVEIEY